MQCVYKLGKNMLHSCIPGRTIVQGVRELYFLMLQQKEMGKQTFFSRGFAVSAAVKRWSVHDKNL